MIKKSPICIYIPFSFIFIYVFISSFSIVRSEEDTAQYFYKLKNVSEAVDKYGQQKTIVVPDQPITFPSVVSYKIIVGKRNAIRCSAEPYAKIFLVDGTGQGKEELYIPYGTKREGNITLNPGQFCRIIIYAGKYQNLFSQAATRTSLECSFQTVRVTAEERNTPGHFTLTAEGPLSAGNWTWTLPNNRVLSGPSVNVSFPTGYTPINLSYNNEKVKETLPFSLRIPDVLEAEPTLSEITGYEEFTVDCSANVINHYKSTSLCLWNFGDGTPLVEGTDVSHTYKRAGTYTLTLKIKNSYGASLEKKWDISVYPFEIINAGSVTPSEGIIPFRIKYYARPKILGTPSLLHYHWSFGDGGTSTEPSGEHVYRRAGTYAVTLSIKDARHPKLKVKPCTFYVTALPPVLKINPQASPASGIIPLTVKFQPNPEVEGGPTRLEYYWDFGDKTYSRESNPTHTFTELGNYDVRLEVFDRLNGTKVSQIVTVETLPPVVSARGSLSPLSGHSPLTVFGEGAADVEGHPVNLVYTWFVNNRPVYTGKSFHYTFNSPGVYTVSLEIVDKHPKHTGRAYQTWEVKVSPPPPR